MFNKLSKSWTTSEILEKLFEKHFEKKWSDIVNYYKFNLNFTFFSIILILMSITINKVIDYFIDYKKLKLNS